MDADLNLRMLATIQCRTIRNPIPGHELADMYGIELRQVQTVVEILRKNGHKIGANQGEPQGYFKARNPEEMYETAELYRDRARKYFKMADELMDFHEQDLSIWNQGNGEAA
jgi:biotin operon repressor